MNLANLFNVATLTAAVNKLPAVPGKVGAMGLFQEKGITTTTVVIDQQEGRLILVPNASRNADPQPAKGSSRSRRGDFRQRAAALLFRRQHPDHQHI